MEQQVERWLATHLKRTIAAAGKATLPPQHQVLEAKASRLLLLEGPLASGKTQLALGLATTKSLEGYKVALITTSWSRSRTLANPKVRDLPLLSELHVESAGSCALRVLKSDLAIAQGRQQIDSSKLLLSRAELQGFLQSILFLLPETRFRPMLDPTAYIPRLAAFIELMQKCGLSSSTYEEWVSKRASDVLDSPYEVDIQRDLCQVYKSFTDIAKGRGVFGINQCITDASKVLDQAVADGIPLSSTANAVWSSPCDLLILDDFHLHPPLQARFLASLANASSVATLLLHSPVDDSVDKVIPNTFSSNNIPFVLRMFPDLHRVKMAGSNAEDIGSKSTPQFQMLKLENDEVESLGNWILNYSKTKNGDQRNPLIFVIATPTAMDRDDLLALLSSRYSSNQMEVKTFGAKKSLLDCDEIRDIYCFLQACLRGWGESVDRELYRVLTSPFFAYKCTTSDLQYLGELRMKKQLPMIEALKHMDSGKKLVRDLAKVASEAGKSGAQLSSLVSLVIRQTGVIKRLEKSNSAHDANVSRKIADFLQLVARLEQRSARFGGSKRSEIPPPPIDILTLIEAMHQSGSFHAAEDPSDIDEDDVFGSKSEVGAVTSTTTPIPQVKIATMNWICLHTDPNSIKNLVLARASDKKLPPSRLRLSDLPVPWELLQNPRPMDGFDETGPFLSNSFNGPEGHIEQSRRLLENLRTRQTEGVLKYTLSSHWDRPTKLISRHDELMEHVVSPPTTLRAITRKRRQPTATQVRSISTQATYIISSTGDQDDTSPTLDDTQQIINSAIVGKAANMDLVTLSYSRMYEYETCPKRYFYSRVMGLKSPSNPRLVYGKSLHAGLEAHLRQEEPVNKLESAHQSFIDTFDLQLSGKTDPIPDGFHSGSHVAEVRRSGVQVLSSFHRRWQDNPMRYGTIISVERWFEVYWEEAQIFLRGVIDLVERDSATGALCIVDFKSNVLDDSKLRRLGKNNDQLAMYAWAYEKEFKEQPAFVAIESVETGERYTSVATHNTSNIEERLVNAADSIRAKVFDPKPKYAACMFCPFNMICADAAVKKLKV